MLGRVRLILWVAVGIAALALLWLSVPPPSPPRDIVTSHTPLSTIGGPFTLIGSDAKPFASSELAGKPYAIFFGFTHCPDVCPTTLARLAKLRTTLGKGDDAFAIVFVTVDPDRDGPTEVGTYAGLFATPVIGLTGTQAQIDRVKQQYKIFSEKVAQPGGGYTVDHTATVLLMDRSGQFIATLAPDEGDAVALDKLRRVTS